MARPMREWQTKWPEARPRWGTYSVRAHTDLRQLIADALLYDVLVFPCPVADGADYSRWEAAGWDPDLLELRTIQLGDAAVTIPWDRQLRDMWAYKFKHLTEEQRQDPYTAYDLTSWQLATDSFHILMGQDDDRAMAVAQDPPQIHPRFAERDGRPRAQREQLELVAAFQRPWEAVCFAGTSETADLDPQTPGIPDAGARLRLRLAVPEDADETMFHRTLDTIGDPDFQQARRRLWSWEQALPKNVTPQEAHKLLETLVTDYNAAVQRQIKQTRLKTVFFFVPIGAGLAVDSLTSGGMAHTLASAGVSVVINRIKARFPFLKGAAARASHHPGSALHGMLSVVAVACPDMPFLVFSCALASKRYWEADEYRAEVPGFRHLASPRRARSIRFTLSERSGLLIIQQITPSTRTARKTAAASAGMPIRTRTAAGSIPPTTLPACFRTFFTVPRSCDVETAARTSPGGRGAAGGARTGAAAGGRDQPGRVPIARSGTPGHIAAARSKRAAAASRPAAGCATRLRLGAR